jgi:PleD family two-component response regulator
MRKPNDKLKVLAVDDDDLHLYTVKELLDNENVEVVTHKSWLGVTNVLKKLQPDLVLLDVNMPALSGDKLSQIVRPFCDACRIPIYFYSSNDEDSLRKLTEECKVAGYICKGDLPSLKARVYQHVSSYRDKKNIPLITTRTM